MLWPQLLTYSNKLSNVIPALGVANTCSVEHAVPADRGESKVLCQ